MERVEKNGMEDGFYHGIGKMKKPATKVMAPPGGETQINVFAAVEPEPSKPINKCQEERSRSTVFAGPTDNIPDKKRQEPAQPQCEPGKQPAKPSTRVINPPGGRTSVSIGGPGSEDGSSAPKNNSYQTSSPFATNNDPAPKVVQQSRPAPNTQSAGNPLIGGDGVAMGGTRARQPPGGASHGIF